MPPSNLTPLISQYGAALHRDYSTQRLIELCNLLDRILPCSLFDSYLMPDESQFYSSYGSRAPTAAELNAAGAVYPSIHDSNVSYNSQTPPLRPRALTGTSNDNPRATKRRIRSEAHGQEPSRVDAPLDSIFIDGAVHPVYGHTQDHFSETSPHRRDTPLHDAFIGNLHGPAGNSTHLAHDYTHGHALEAANGLWRATPATPFAATETHGHPVLPPITSLSSSFVSRLPPIHSAPATSTSSAVSLDHVSGTRYTLVPQVPACLDNGLTSGYGSSASRGMHLPPLSVVDRSLQVPTTTNVHAPLTPSTSRVTTPAVYNPVPRPSGPMRIPSPSLGAAYSPYAFQPMPMASPVCALPYEHDSSPPEFELAFGPSARRLEWMREDALLDEEDGEYNEEELREEVGADDPALLDIKHADADWYRSWKSFHPPSRYPGGPPYLGRELTTILLKEGRHGCCRMIWEEYLIIEYYLYKFPPRCPGIIGALRLPTYQGKHPKYHISLQNLREGVFFNGRRNPALHRMLRAVALTYQQIRLFDRLNHIQYDFSRRDDELIDEIGPRISHYQTMYGLLKTFNAWRYICYCRNGTNSWFTGLDMLLKDHPIYSVIEMHDGAISPRPKRIGAPNGSRSSSNTVAHGTQGSALKLAASKPTTSKPTAPKPTAPKPAAPKPAAPRKTKGKGKADAPPVITWQVNSAVGGSVSSLPSAPSSTTVSEISASTSASRTRSSAPTDPHISGTTSLAVPHKSVPPRVGNRRSSSTPEINLLDEVSQPTAIEIIRETQASKHDLHAKVVAIKQETERNKLGLLEREQEKSERFREQSHQLAVAKFGLAQLETTARLNSEQAEKDKQLATSIVECGPSHPCYLDAVQLLRNALRAGTSTLHAPDVAAPARAPSVVPPEMPNYTRATLSPASRPLSLASPIRLPPLQPSGLHGSGGGCTSSPRHANNSRINHGGEVQHSHQRDKWPELVRDDRV
ncbi:hypothetical protein FRC10_003491 [Ceratobasidium sp. 414]|nr:hypothetical protein FRC10_003491 [Ceratobasidium sp. 414]